MQEKEFKKLLDENGISFDEKKDTIGHNVIRVQNLQRNGLNWFFKVGHESKEVSYMHRVDNIANKDISVNVKMETFAAKVSKGEYKQIN